MEVTVQHFLQRAQELLRINKPELARNYLDGVIFREPGNALALFELGRIELNRGRHGISAQYGRRILSAKSAPRPALGHLLIGNAARAQREHLRAVRAYQAALRIEPNLTEAICNMGGSLVECGRTGEAVTLLRQGVANHPGEAAMHANLGIALQRSGLLAEAAACLQTAVKLQPGLDRAWLLLGTTSLEGGQIDDAAKALVRAIELAPDAAAAAIACYNYALILIQQGRRLDGLAMLAQTLQGNPNIAIAEGALLYQAQFLCQWDLVAQVAPKVLARIRTSPDMVAEPFSALAIPGATKDDHRLASAAYARRTLPSAPAMVPVGHCWADSRTRLRVGFLCADFRDHPMGILMSSLMTNVDRTRLEPIVLTYGDDRPSRFRGICLAAGERHVNLNPPLEHSAERAAEVIADLKLDVLLDLQCYTSGTRSEMLRFRPAPVQGHYLVYPTTAAAAAYDFTILDPVMCPPGDEALFSEVVLRFRTTYFPLMAPELQVPTPSRADEGLPDNAIVFVSMNQAYKIGKDVFLAWCAILRRVPGSVL